MNVSGLDPALRVAGRFSQKPVSPQRVGAPIHFGADEIPPSSVEKPVEKAAEKASDITVDKAVETPTETPVEATAAKQPTEVAALPTPPTIPAAAVAKEEPAEDLSKTGRRLLRWGLKYLGDGLDSLKKSVGEAPKTPTATNPADVAPVKVDYSKINALLDAVKTGDVAAVETKIAEGVDVNTPNETGLNALMVAIQHDQKELVKKLAPLTTDLSARCQEVKVETLFSEKITQEAQSALEMTVVLNQPESLQALLDAGAKVNDGTALCLATKKGLGPILTLLLTTQPDLTKTDKSFRGRPIHVAAEFGQTDCLQQLLAAGADKNDLASDLGPPLVQAAAKGHVETVQALLDANADVHAVEPKKGITAYNAAISTLVFTSDTELSSNCAQIMSLLQEKGAEVCPPTA